MPAVNNFLVVCGQTLTLISTVLLYVVGSHSFLLIALANTVPPLLVYLICCFYTFNFKYKKLRPSLKYVRKSMIKELFSFGLKFFILQISGGVLFLSSNILISKLFSPDVVTPYQITYRYFSIALLVFTIICTPFWTATTDAYKKNDIEWMKSSNRYLNKLILFILGVMILMVVVSPLFYKIWVGQATRVPFEMTLMMALFMSITICSLRYSYILNGFGVLHLQLITTLSAAVAFIPLSVFAADETKSIVPFMGVMCFVNLPGLVINIIQYKKIINKTADGIWKR